MKSLMRMWMIFAALAVIFFTDAGQAEETVRLTSGEWPPYFSQNLKHYGIGSRIVTEAFALEGIKVEYGFFPWKRALRMAQNGEWDGAVGWETNAEREKDFCVSEQVWEAPWVFFHLKTHPFDWKTFDDLKNIRIGATLEYMYTPEFLEAERAGKILVDRTPADEQNIKKLLYGRIDIFPQLLDIGYYQLRQYSPESADLITHHPFPLGKHSEQLFLTKKKERCEELTEIFNRGLRRLKDSGKYDAYFEEFRKGEQGK